MKKLIPVLLLIVSVGVFAADKPAPDKASTDKTAPESATPEKIIADKITADKLTSEAIEKAYLGKWVPSTVPAYANGSEPIKSILIEKGKTGYVVTVEDATVNYEAAAYISNGIMTIQLHNPNGIIPMAAVITSDDVLVCAMETFTREKP